MQRFMVSGFYHGGGLFSAISGLELGDFGVGALGTFGVEVALGILRPMQDILVIAPALRTESDVRWRDLG